MVNAWDFAGSNFITAEELGASRRTAVIFEVTPEELGPDRKRKLVLSLTGSNGAAWPRRLVLNDGNTQRLIAAFGPETDTWASRKIIVSTKEVQFQGRNVKGIHVEAVQGGNGAALPAPGPVAHSR
jgi:hypothetical protein